MSHFVVTDVERTHFPNWPSKVTVNYYNLLYTFDTWSQYKFYLAFENSFHCNDYLSEKFWRNALHEGAVPIVFGTHPGLIRKKFKKKKFLSKSLSSKILRLIILELEVGLIFPTFHNGWTDNQGNLLELFPKQ